MLQPNRPTNRYCVMCNERLVPQKAPQELWAGVDGSSVFLQRPIPYALCFECDSVMCLSHLTSAACSSLSSSSRPRPSSHETAPKNASFFLKQKGVVELSPVEEDEEPHESIQAHCPFCSTQRSFLLRFTSASSSRPSICRRCGSFFGTGDPHFEGGCPSHKGQHELPVDASGKPVFGFGLGDIGGMYGVGSVHLRVYPGRWTCCGALCFHDHLGCPLADLLLVHPVSYPEALRQRYQEGEGASASDCYFGCQRSEGGHMERFEKDSEEEEEEEKEKEERESSTDSVRAVLERHKNDTIQTHYITQDHKTVPVAWRRQVNWNAGTPFRFALSQVEVPQDIRDIEIERNFEFWTAQHLFAFWTLISCCGLMVSALLSL
ncbi:hypothetical protein QOT17_011276 [Balamuthia mandrillaris]